MRSMLVLAGSLALLAAIPRPARAGGDANFWILAARNISGDFENGDAPAFGVNVSGGGRKWPVHVEGAWLRSTGVELGGGDELNVSEVAIGARKSWVKEGRKLRPFVAGGLAFVTADYELVLPGPGNNTSGRDSSVGAYVDGGLAWRFGAHFNVGLDLRLVAGPKVESDGLDADLGYQQLGFLLGFGW